MPKLLLVADSPWVINDVKSALALGDWDLEELTDPRKAAEVAVAIGADVVVADLQVSSMGGMAVIRDIRAVTDVRSRPRLVLLLDRSADEFIARRAGADASVVKPFEAQDFRATLTS